MSVKGQELPMHEPRIKFGLDLGYTTSPTGADHCHNIHDTAYEAEAGAIKGMAVLGDFEPLPADDLGPEKVRLTKYHIDWQVLYNCVGLCMFMPYSKEQMQDVIQAVTGWPVSIFELMNVGERALAMARVYNHREGFTAADDKPLWRISTKFESGPAGGRRGTHRRHHPRHRALLRDERLRQGDRRADRRQAGRAGRWLAGAGRGCSRDGIADLTAEFTEVLKKDRVQ